MFFGTLTPNKWLLWKEGIIIVQVNNWGERDFTVNLSAWKKIESWLAALKPPELCARYSDSVSRLFI